MDRSLVLILVFACALISSAPEAQELEFEDLNIRLLPGLPAEKIHGYHEYTFEIKNTSHEDAHHIRLDLPASGSQSTGLHFLRQVTGSATVGPGSTVQLSLHQPPLKIAGYGVGVTVDGRRLEERLQLNYAHPSDTHLVTVRKDGNSVAELTLRVLVSQTVRAASAPQQDDVQRYQTATTPTSAWSGDWLAYSGFDGVVLTAEDLKDLNAEVETALERYVEAGGSLVFLGVTESALPPRFARLPAQWEESLRVAYAGFGAVLSSALRTDALREEQTDRLIASWFKSRRPWSMLRNPGGVHRLFPVKPDTRTPVRGIFLLVMGFTFLIGPVNVLVLGHLRKRIWLLFTVPAAALLACFLVFLYTFLSEGLVRIERNASLTVLDEKSHRAISYGWSGYYSTLTPGEGMVFDRRTEVSAVSQWRWGQGRSQRRLDWDEAQHLASGWMSARLPSYFVVRKNQSRRERLGVRYRDGSPEVTNGLGVMIRELYLADTEGNIYASQETIEAGASSRLKLRVERADAAPSVLRDLYRAELPKHLEKLETTPVSYLAPRTYVALVDVNPFLERPLRDVREHRSRAVIYGLLGDGSRVDG